MAAEVFVATWLSLAITVSCLRRYLYRECQNWTAWHNTSICLLHQADEIRNGSKFHGNIERSRRYSFSCYVSSTGGGGTTAVNSWSTTQAWEQTQCLTDKNYRIRYETTLA